MCRKKRRLYNAAKKRKKDKLWDAYRKLQDKTGNALRTAHWDYVNGIISDGLEKGNHQPFWSYIKHQRQDGQGVAPLRVGSQLYIDSASKAATLSEQFKSVFSRDSPALANKRLNPEAQYPDIPQVVIQVEGITKLLHNLNPSKAGGPDEIPARVLKNLAAEVSPILTALFKQSLHTGNLPTHWKTAWIAPFSKKVRVVIQPTTDLFPSLALHVS